MGPLRIRTCTHKITNLPTQVNISDNLYFLWNCNNMYTLLILDKDKYLICPLCQQAIFPEEPQTSTMPKHQSCLISNKTKHQPCQNINHANKSTTPKHQPCQNKLRLKVK